MSSSAIEIREARVQRVTVTEETLTMDLADGRSISVPLAWYLRLLHGSPAERGHWRMSGNGEGVNWPDLDQDISVEAGRDWGHGVRRSNRIGEEPHRRCPVVLEPRALFTAGR